MTTANAEPISCIITKDGNTCIVFDAANPVVTLLNVSNPNVTPTFLSTITIGAPGGSEIHVQSEIYYT